jgi:hypothetical protein
MVNGRSEPREDAIFKVFAPPEIPILDQLRKLLAFLELQKISWTGPRMHGASIHGASLSLVHCRGLLRRGGWPTRQHSRRRGWRVRLWDRREDP